MPGRGGRRGRASASTPDAERGSVTAEFVIVVPALLAVLALALGSIAFAAHRVRLTSVVAELARLEARGETEAAAGLSSRLGPDVSVARSRDGPMHCVSLTDRPVGGVLAALAIEVRACAAYIDGGGA